MKLLYGTANPAKLQHMREMLEGLGLEIIGLNDVNMQIGPIDESGNHPMANARIKAMEYYKAAKMPVFSCDTGLYIEGLNDEEQPGVHVRRVKGKVLGDEEMIEYYTNLVIDLGTEPKAKYKNAICLILDEKRIFEHDGDDIADHFILTSKAHPQRNAGFPIDSISLDIETREYFMDLRSNSKNENELSKGFKNFFISYLLNS